eukprot:scaffold333550_cov37-Prasinocladus_malaysianus.AAC.2
MFGAVVRVNDISGTRAPRTVPDGAANEHKPTLLNHEDCGNAAKHIKTHAARIGSQIAVQNSHRQQQTGR